MDDVFMQGLSQNFLRILDDEEYYDIVIEVGDEMFRAHMVILNYRSTSLRRILSKNKKKSDGNLVHIKLPNILPGIFKIILKYIYGGKLSFEDYDTSDIVKILVAAGELNLHELIAYLQTFLIETNWMEQNFNLIYKTSFEHGPFLELQEYCNDLISKIPDKIFELLDPSSAPEKLVISLVQSNNLQMSEIQVWKNVLKWGLAQNPELPTDPSTFSKDDFNILKNTLQQLIPFIKIDRLTSKEFWDNIVPYKEILPDGLYMNLLKGFLNLHPDSRLNHKSKPCMTKKTVTFSLPSPSTPCYSGSSAFKVNSQEQNINKVKEVTDPLSTRIQLLPKNQNCNEEKASSNKPNELNHIRGRGFKQDITPKLFDSQFIEDVNIQDGTILAPQAKFEKTWKLSNNGRFPWPDETVLRCIDGDRMFEFNITPRIRIGSVEVGKSVDISVALQAPSDHGKHVSYWKLSDGTDNQFGSKVWCDIMVKDAD
ncbi:hypothetical protein RhiirC2_850438 [Rhizophagus irregularis]|uniref:BTB domain-containing protein n=1 Tax=Rhizophagus irregularis TaxID=588596 RepID=A0A2N1N7G9_9GLOM|nr:hypothetical protein RhiirC2_850438 [Rhizophagus irregularis]